MTTKLELYNGALRLVPHQRLASLSEDVEARFELDAIYDAALQAMLEEAGWKFALRVSQLTYETDIEPAFGRPYAFEQPADFVRIARISTDPNFTPGHEPDYEEANGFFYSTTSEFYIKYVSNGATYGLNLLLYPQYYCKALHAYFAREVGAQLATDGKFDYDRLDKIYQKYLMRSKQSDALDEPVKFPPTGRVVASRHGRQQTTFQNGRMRF